MTQEHTPLEMGPYVSELLFKELINVFAQNLPKKQYQLSEVEQNFLNFFKSKHDKFNVLTKAIFWDNNLSVELIAANAEFVNQYDKYLNYPLKLSIILEKYQYAQLLLANGAKIFIEDKIVLEINIINMLQRGESLMQSILPHISASNADEARQYIYYLMSSLKGIKSLYNFYYRDVMNPPIREFGQQLETISFYQETPSYYGLFGSSFVNISDHLVYFARHSNNKIIKKIAKIFVATQNICNIIGNYPVKDGYASNVLENVLNAYHSKDEVALIPGGWPGTSIALAVIGSELVFANLGTLSEGTQDNHAKILIFPINDIAKLDADFIEQWVTGLASGVEPAKIIASLGCFSSYDANSQLELPASPIDNCVCSNTQAAIMGIIYLLSGKELAAAQELFQQYQNSLHDFTVKKMIEQLRNPAIFLDHKYECCTMAIAYINSNYRSKDHDVLNRLVILHSALQYIGLDKELPSLLYSKALFAIHEYIRQTNKQLARDVVDSQKESINFIQKQSNADEDEVDEDDDDD
jgi:hypothetical protein